MVLLLAMFPTVGPGYGVPVFTDDVASSNYRACTGPGRYHSRWQRTLKQPSELRELAALALCRTWSQLGSSARPAHLDSSPITSDAVYRHRQIGYLPIALGVILALTMGSVAWRRSPMIGVAVLLVIMLGPLLFSSLTITICDGMLSSHFGFGFWLKRFAVADIVDATLASSNWAEGWGIRVTSHGMLYNVSGTRGVEIRLRSGTRFRLGSDEPDLLLRALQAVITAPEQPGT